MPATNDFNNTSTDGRHARLIELLQQAICLFQPITFTAPTFIAPKYERSNITRCVVIVMSAALAGDCRSWTKGGMRMRMMRRCSRFAMWRWCECTGQSAYVVFVSDARRI